MQEVAVNISFNSIKYRELNRKKSLFLITAILIAVAGTGILLYFMTDNDLLRPRVSVIVWRLLDCNAECMVPVDQSIISKYPELQSALEVVDQRYNELKGDCDTNQCLQNRWSSNGSDNRVSFTVPNSVGVRLHADFTKYGDVTASGIEFSRTMIAFQLGKATYVMWVSFE